jgi:2-dehydro-3-deoxygluconokinase
MQYVDILITTEEDTFRVFKTRGKDYREVAKLLSDRFGFDVVCITIRENITVWRNRWTSIAYHKGEYFDDTTYEVEIVDRIGSGDAFTAGFLYAYLKKDRDISAAIKYGNASSVLKHSIPGDLSFCSIEEIDQIVEGKGQLRIRR